MANLSLRMLYFCLIAAVLINVSNYTFMRIFYPGGKRISNYYYPKTESGMETDRSLLYSEEMLRGFSSNSDNEMISTIEHHEIFHNNKSANATELNDMIVEVSYCPVLPPGLGEIDIHSNQLDEKQFDVKHSNVKLGGAYQPSTCKARQSAAVIIAYRSEYIATVSPLYLLDGLTSLSYKLESFEAKRLYTYLKVNIYETNDTKSYKHFCDKLLNTTSTQTIQIKATTTNIST